MNPDPQFQVFSGSPTSQKQLSTKKLIVLCVVTFISFVGMKCLWRWGLLPVSDVVDAALFSIFMSFGVPAIIRYTERRDSILIHKTLRLP
jgi:hypothetical protein